MDAEKERRREEKEKAEKGSIEAFTLPLKEWSEGRKRDREETVGKEWREEEVMNKKSRDRRRWIKRKRDGPGMRTCRTMTQGKREQESRKASARFDFAGWVRNNSANYYSTLVHVDRYVAPDLYIPWLWSEADIVDLPYRITPELTQAKQDGRGEARDDKVRTERKEERDIPKKSVHGAEKYRQITYAFLHPHTYSRMQHVCIYTMLLLITDNI